MKITLTINNQEITMEYSEAQKLWSELDKIFGKREPFDWLKDRDWKKWTPVNPYPDPYNPNTTPNNPHPYPNVIYCLNK